MAVFCQLICPQLLADTQYSQAVRPAWQYYFYHIAKLDLSLIYATLKLGFLSWSEICYLKMNKARWLSLQMT
ncbi:protein of unknown function [Moritella yayanosii]|uniref:Uncharacterized protein n=1 Tax=Moritella yayanosii TaxID=69539 RepID=A0A330LPH8_9GAMM|nr:protein of unknown function [Moritella yayanosii]